MRQFIKGDKRGRFLLTTGAVIILCLGLVLYFRVMHSSSAGRAGNGVAQTTVDVVTVGKTDLIKRIALTGQTVPKAQVDIAAKYQGKLVAVNAELGQSVVPGQVLIEQDTGDAELAVAQNRAAYQQAMADAVNSGVAYQANYNKAKADYDRTMASYQRYKTLYEAGGIAKDTLESAEQQMLDAKASLDALVNQMNANSVPATVESAQAAASKAKSSVSAAEKQRNDLLLRAPFSGIVGYRQAEVGAIVSAGQKLLTIVDNSKIYVDCQVSERDLPAFTLGMPVNVSLEALSKEVPGTIIYISPASDSTNLVFSLRIELNNPTTDIRGGMFARTVVNSVLRPQALVLPKDAIVEKNGKSHVFIIDAQNKAEERDVTVGASGDADVEIIAGLNEGERVAVSNLSRLRSGLQIEANPVTIDNRGGQS